MDIIFVSVPYTDTDEPAMAPALLKAVALQHGYSSCSIDLNIEIVNCIKNHPKKSNLIKFFSFAEEQPDLADEVIALVDYSVDRILSYDPKIVGLSLLTYNSQLFTTWLSVRLKMVRPDIKIVIGGSGIKNFIAGTNNSFCDQLLAVNLIDHYITGDGELSLVEYLKGNYNYPGINSLKWSQIQNLDQFDFPNYDDYDFDQYDQKVIPITDSRGCVRTCEFCDIIEHWTKYVYRSAESVFEEMLAQTDRHGIYNFSMRNSLTNGNMKEFKKLLDLIGNYNQKNNQQQISWQGYFIVRESHQHPEEIFEKIQQSNGSIWLGVESVIEHVRYGMGKKFSNQAIDYHLEMTQKYQIPTMLLIMTGNPTETRKDYEFTKQWFKDRYSYAGNSVNKISLAMSSILPGTEWSRKQDEMNLTLGKYPNIWINQDINIGPEERSKYWDELLDICAPFMIKKDYNSTKASSTVTRTVIDGQNTK